MLRRDLCGQRREDTELGEDGLGGTEVTTPLPSTQAAHERRPEWSDRTRHCPGPSPRRAGPDSEAEVAAEGTDRWRP